MFPELPKCRIRILDVSLVQVAVLVESEVGMCTLNLIRSYQRSRLRATTLLRMAALEINTTLAFTVTPTPYSSHASRRHNYLVRLPVAVRRISGLFVFRQPEHRERLGGNGCVSAGHFTSLHQVGDLGASTSDVTGVVSTAC